MSQLTEGLSSVLENLVTSETLLALAMGTCLGWIFGILPGLQSITALVLVLPFTFGWNPTTAMYLFAGIIGAAGQGGAVTSILLNMPGTAQNAATAIEGFPLTQRGKGLYALAVSASASALGALLGLIALVILIPVFFPFLLAFGPVEQFWIMALGLVSLAAALPGPRIKTVVAVGLGVLMGAVGFGGPTIAGARFTFGSTYLLDGLELLTVVIGLLVASEAMSNLIGSRRGATTVVSRSQPLSRTRARELWRDCISGLLAPLRHMGLLIRSSAIGTVVGAIPGIGGTVAQFLAYNAAYAASRRRSEFGQGSVEGLIAAEAATNSKEGGTLLPTLLFGIPGNGEMAVVLAAWQLHGLQPGPFFLDRHADLAWSLILGLVFSNIFSSLINLAASPITSRIPSVRGDLLGASVLVLSTLAAYSIRQNVLDVALLILVAFLGFMMKAAGFSILGTVVGFILGDIMESNFYTALQSGLGDYRVFVSSPLSLGLAVATGCIAFGLVTRACGRWGARQLVGRRAEG